ncbi:DUF5317 family protein [Actinoplanes sp. NPDC051513]|uniref:DUF5317 family protein n=1 Tax=Actinoplanes sp. NPDC051513 TaxID=3363908 RepID=UPI0037B93C45
MVAMSLRFAIVIAAPPLAGVALGYLSGGRISGLRTIPVRALWLVWLAAAAQFAQYYVPGLHRAAMLAVVFGVVLIWLAVNLPRWPVAARIAGVLIVLGASLNGVAIALNGRMPYDARAAAGAGTPKNVPANERTRAAILGDTIPLVPLHALISPGDILIGGGACAFVVIAMRRSERRSHDRDPVLAPHHAGALHPGHAGPVAVHRRGTVRAGRLNP